MVWAKEIPCSVKFSLRILAEFIFAFHAENMKSPGFTFLKMNFRKKILILELSFTSCGFLHNSIEICS